MGKACPACGKDNKQEAKFCGGCGHAFAGEAAAPSPSIPSASPVAPDVQCASCGRMNTPGTRFCAGCGQMLSAASSASAVRSGPSDAPPARSGIPTSGIVLLVLVVVSLLALGATWWWTRQPALQAPEVPAATEAPADAESGSADDSLWESTTPEPDVAAVAPAPARTSTPKTSAPKPATAPKPVEPAPAPAATTETPAPAKPKKTVKEICQDKNLFSRPICESRYCEKSEYSGTPYCAEVRARRGGPDEIKN